MMVNDTRKTFYVLKKGAIQEEAWDSWSDIEDVCRAGGLSPDAKIFFSDENEWKLAIDTELAEIFESSGGAGASGEMADQQREAYEEAAGQAREFPEKWQAAVTAAELAITIGERDKACGHFQDALLAMPYHPRIVQEARKNLSPAELQNLRHLDKPESVWADVVSIFAYPFARGPLYLAIPSAVLAGLAFIPFVNLLVPALLYMWGVWAIESEAQLQKRPPMWHAALANPLGLIVRPLLSAAIVAALLYTPFLAIAQALVMTGLSSAPNMLVALQKEPILVVLLSMVSLLSWPGVLVLASSPSTRFGRTVNPGEVVRLVKEMEREYIAAAGYVALAFCLWAGVTLVASFVPVAGKIVSVVLGVLLMLTTARVLGRLRARFRDTVEDPA